MPAAIHDEAIDHKQHDLPDDGRQPRRDVEELVQRVSVEHSGGDKAADQRSDDPDDCSDDDPAGFEIALAVREVGAMLTNVGWEQTFATSERSKSPDA